MADVSVTRDIRKCGRGAAIRASPGAARASLCRGAGAGVGVCCGVALCGGAVGVAIIAVVAVRCGDIGPGAVIGRAAERRDRVFERLLLGEDVLVRPNDVAEAALKPLVPLGQVLDPKQQVRPRGPLELVVVG